MPANFKVTIITPEKTVFADTAASLIVPAQLGYLGVLANHAPLAANLVAGKIHIRKPSGNSVTFNSTGEGFLQVSHNNVTLALRCLQPET